MENRESLIAHIQQTRLLLQQVWQTVREIHKLLVIPNDCDLKVLQWDLHVEKLLTKKVFEFTTSKLLSFIEYVDWFNFVDLNTSPIPINTNDLSLAGRIALYRKTVSLEFIVNDTFWNEYYIWSKYVNYDKLFKELRLKWVVTTYKSAKSLCDNIVNVSQFLYNILDSKWSRALKVLCDYYNIDDETYNRLLNESKLMLILKN